MTGSCFARAGALVSRWTKFAAAAGFAALAAAASPAYAQSADLVVNQADSPDPGPAGGVFTYTIRVDNNGPDTSTGISFANTLPPGSTFVGVATTQGTCNPPVAGVVNCDLGTLTFLANATVTIQVILPTPGVYTNTVSVTAATPDPNTSNNLNVAESTTAQNATDMAVSVTSPVAPISSGSAYSYVVTATNNGPLAAASQTITFAVPAGACVTSVPTGTGWSCSPSTGYPLCAGQTITCTRNTSLASGASAPNLTVPAVANVGGTITAAFTVSSPLPDGNPANNTVTANTTVNGGFSDVQITKSAAPTTVGVGSNVTYTLTPRLNGGEPAGQGGGLITVTDTLNANLTYVSAAGTGWTCGYVAPTVTCTRPGPFSANYTNMPTIAIVATVNATGTIPNTATIAAPEPDPVPGNNSGSVSITGSNSADLSMTKAAVIGSSSISAVVPGQDFSYTLTVRNTGPSPVAIGQTVTVTDTIPAGVSLRAAITGGGWTCSTVPVTPPFPAPGPITVTCTRTLTATQAANSNFPVITLPVEANVGGTTTNTACVALSGTGPSDGNAANNCSSVNVISTDAAAAADLRVVSKTASPNPVAAGQDLTYVISVDNQGPGTATNVTVTDALASLVTAGGFQSATPSQGTCTPSGVTAGPTVNLSCNLGTLAPLATATVTVVVRPSIATTGNRSNQAVVTSPDVGDPNRDNNTGSVTSQVTAVADVTVTKTDAPDPVQAGTPLTYVITARNNGPSTAAAVTITDTLPANAAFLSLATTPAGAGAPTCSTPAVGSLGGTLACTWATLTSGTQQTATVVVRPATGATSVQNDVTIATTTAESNGANNSATATTAVTNAAVDLVINKVDGVDPVALGQLTSYVITVSNGGPSLATNLVMTDNFPTGSPTATFSYQGNLSASGGGSCVEPALNATSGTITCTWPSLASGSLVVVYYEMRAESIASGTSGTTFNSASVTATEPETQAANNSTTHSTTSRQAADLALTKSAPASIVPGNPLAWTLTVTNNGPAASNGAQVTDTLPAGVTFVSASPGCAFAAGTVTCTLGALANGASTNLTINVTVNSPYTGANPLVNSATVTAVNEIDIVPGNNTGTASTTITQQADLALTKTVNVASPAVGSNVVFTITVTNNGPNQADSVQVSDQLPAGFTFVSATASVGSYASGTGIWTIGALAFPGSATLQITATVNASGPYTNTATVSSPTPDPNPGNETGTATPVPLSPPTLGKSIAPATITAGGPATLTITLGNPNTLPLALAAAFTDTMPAGVTTTSGNTGTCAGVTVTSTTITMASGTVLPAGGCTIVVTITSTTPGTVTNTTGSLQTNAGTAAPASAPLTVNAAIATLGKTIAPNPIIAGGTSTLTITLGNPNATALTLTADFTDPMPAGVTTTSGNTGTCTGVTVAPALVTMASGSTIPPGGCTIVVTVTSTTPGTVTNTTGTLTTGAGTTTPATAPLTVNAAAATLGKTILPATIVSGGTSTLTLTLGNPNATALTLTADFTDPMPAGVTTTSGNTGTCTGVTVTPTAITMASGSTIPVGGCTIVATITSATPGTVTNTTGSVQTAGGTTPPASAPLTVTATSSTIGKTILPATIVAGGTSTLTITLSNANATPLTLTAAFTDAMPAGVTITSPSNSGTCAAVAVTPTLITKAAGSTIPAGGCTIVVTITSATPGTVTNTTSPVQTDGGTSPPASAPLTVTTAAATLAKAIAPASIAPGGTATLTLTLGNPNATPLTLTLPFVDQMPAGVTTTSGNTGTCTGVTVTAAMITMAAAATIPHGGCTIVVTITSSTLGTVTNTTGALSTQGGITPPASAPLTVTAAGVTLAKTILPSTIAAGGTATLTLTLGNPGTAPLTLTVPFTDPMPAGVTTTSGNTGTCTGVTVTPTTITMASGATVPPGGCTIVVTITSSTPGTVTNTTGPLTTSGGTAPPASAPITVTAPGPTLAKTILPSTIAAGGTATLTLTLGNATAAPLTLTAPFTDTMPAGVTTTSGNTGTCTGVTVTPSTITMAAGSTIPPGGCTIVVTITSSTPGTVTNTTGPLTTSGGTAPPASAPITVTGSGPTLTKSIAPATIAAGGTATLTLTLGNPGAAPLTLTAPFTDTMPAGVTTTSGNTGTCTGVTVTSTTITMASGSTIPPGGCTIVVTVTSSTPGTVTNTTGPLTTSGGTAPPASAPITVTGTTVDLAIAKQNTGPFSPGQIGAQYAIVVSNVGTVPTSGPVTVTDTLPPGLTATAIGGAGWTCTQPAGPCTRSDPLAPGASYPVITLTVNIAPDAPSPVVNVVTVAGGGDTNGANNSAKNVVEFAPPLPVEPIPVDSPAMLLLLAALLALVGGRRVRGARIR